MFLRIENRKQFLVVKYVSYVFLFWRTENRFKKQFPNRPLWHV